MPDPNDERNATQRSIIPEPEPVTKFVFYLLSEIRVDSSPFSFKINNYMIVNA